jgi:predicted RNase H-like HicB family nuclease
MKQNSYEMIIWWSAEDNAYLVDVPELPGCMAHGLTRQQAIKNAEEAIKFWIKAKGRRIGYSAAARAFVVCVNILKEHSPKSARGREDRRTPKRFACSLTAQLRTLPPRHVRRFGLRRQSAAATALWIVPGRLWKL